MGNHSSFAINYYQVVKMNIVNKSHLIVHYVNGSKVIFECGSEDNAKEEINKLISFAERLLHE
jgi:hypothetical protein